jgi:hypothetical protein
MRQNKKGVNLWAANSLSGQRLPARWAKRNLRKSILNSPTWISLTLTFLKPQSDQIQSSKTTFQCKSHTQSLCLHPLTHTHFKDSTIQTAPSKIGVYHQERGCISDKPEDFLKKSSTLSTPRSIRSSSSSTGSGRIGSSDHIARLIDYFGLWFFIVSRRVDFWPLVHVCFLVLWI